MDEKPSHRSVMLKEMLKAFQGIALRYFYDGTLGGGGHAAALLAAHPEIECYIACDRDADALEMGKQILHPWKHKIRFIHGNFADLDQHIAKVGLQGVDGFFLTLGFHQCNSIKRTEDFLF